MAAPFFDIAQWHGRPINCIPATFHTVTSKVGVYSLPAHARCAASARTPLRARPDVQRGDSQASAQRIPTDTVAHHSLAAERVVLIIAIDSRHDHVSSNTIFSLLSS
ncbi:hypothetical protein [Burkholderia sp. AU31652]|uniref:hypothetical protein n=1 Tax=Burkholderia sp. AU31652 TaxID=2015354 RepID=UPI00117862B5|nr:hypothetical protein [Burkholderia sp. AU31652]